MNFELFTRFLIVALPIFVTGCTGSAYKLPPVSSQEMSLIQNEIDADTSELKIYKRSDANYKSRIAKISTRLQKNAAPLCEISEYAPCHFEVNYNNENTINAVAYEHYKITVYKGLLQYLKNDDEIAAVIGHEMGHHLAHHNKEQLQNAQAGAAISGVLTAVLIGAANANNPYYNAYQQQQDQQTLQNMMVAGAEIGAISYSKEQEREADLLGAYLLKHSGYNLESAQNMMYVLSRLNGDPVAGKAALLDTHPPSAQRVVAWSKAIEEIEGNETKLPYLKSNKQ
ncbi:MAG: M48 family metallopeptidase [Pseudomonadota bacterium]|nr:M48 family metallopeptidase [Pseudomonadota bacterium]